MPINNQGCNTEADTTIIETVAIILIALFAWWWITITDRTVSVMEDTAISEQNEVLND